MGSNVYWGVHSPFSLSSSSWGATELPYGHLDNHLETEGTAKNQIIGLVDYLCKLMMNYERNRRGLTDNPYCKLCSREVEDLNHIFRKCKTMRNFRLHALRDDGVATA